MDLWTNFSRISCTNLSAKFVRIRANSYEFFARKIGYVTNGLYCTHWGGQVQGNKALMGGLMRGTQTLWGA